MNYFLLSLDLQGTSSCTMKYFLVSLAFILPFSFCQDCSDIEYHSAHNLWSSCASQYKEKVHHLISAPLTRDTPRLVCEYVDTGLQECVELLHNCHDSQGREANIQEMLDGFLSVGGKYALKCQPFIQYRKSGDLPKENFPMKDNNEINKDNIQKTTNVANVEKIQMSKETCSESNTDIAEDFMDKCSQKIGAEAYSNINDSEDPIFISNVLCSAEALIYSDCVEDLKKCFSSDYIDWLVKPIKTFLHNLAITKVAVDSLKDCNEYYSLLQDKVDEKHNIMKDQSYNKLFEVEYDNMDYIDNEEDNKEYIEEFSQSNPNSLKETLIDSKYKEVPNKLENNYRLTESKDNIISNKYHKQNQIEDHDKEKLFSKDNGDDTTTLIAINPESINNDQEHNYHKSDDNQIANYEHNYEDRTSNTKTLVDSQYQKVPNNFQILEPTVKSEFHKSSSKYNKQEHNEEKDAKKILTSDLEKNKANINNFEYDYKESNSGKEDQVCFEASLFERITNCSHPTALKVHTEIHHVTDQRILENIACDVLDVIGTDCVKELDQCFSKIDADEIKFNHIEEWKVFIIEMIQGRTGIKISLENCNQLVSEPTIENGDRETPMDKENRYKESDTQKIDKDYEQKDEISYSKSGEKNEPCSKSERRIDEEQLELCIQTTVNKAYTEMKNINDPSRITTMLCSTQRRIDTDCVQHLNKCFSSEYISWLVDPMKKYLQNLAVQKVDAKYLEKCNGIELSQKSEEMQSPPSNLRAYESEHNHQTGDYDYYPQEIEEHHDHTRELSQYRYDSCSETILYEIMDNCSRGVALNVWNSIKDDSSSYRVSNIVCEALTEIGTRCINTLTNCFTKREVTEMKSKQTNQWIKYFHRITIGTTIGRISLENCHFLKDEHVDTHERDTQDRISYNRQKSEFYEKPKPKATSPQIIKATQRIYDITEQTAENHHYTKEETLDKYQDYEECSVSKLEETRTEMSNCSYSTAINVHWNLQAIVDKNTVTNILCDALNKIATECVEILYKCYTPENIIEMKAMELMQMKNYFLQLVKSDYDSQYLERCELKRGRNHPVGNNVLQPITHENLYEERNTEEQHNIQDDTINEPGEDCSESQMQLADDHMTDCTHRTAINAVEQLTDINEPNKAFNILCSALTSINSDCVKTMRKCHGEEYVTWMLEPINNYLLDLGKEKNDAKSLKGCQYRNGFSPYRLP